MKSWTEIHEHSTKLFFIRSSLFSIFGLNSNFYLNNNYAENEKKIFSI